MDKIHNKKMNEDWGTSDWTPVLKGMDRELEHMGAINPETIEQAARTQAEFYHDHMGYDNVEDAKERIITMWMIRKGWYKPQATETH